MFVYPGESARHVMDPISASSARFRRHPGLLLDADDRFFEQGVLPRSLRVVYLNDDMKRLGCIDVDLQSPTWEIECRAFLAHCPQQP